MPLVKLEKINQNSSWALWKIEEDFRQLVREARLHPDDMDELADVHHPRKKLEWLSSRAALNALLQVNNCFQFRIRKDDKGKPYLVDNTFHISLANSFPYGVAIIHRKFPVGIDIEKPSPKLLRVKHKFLNTNEDVAVNSDLDKLCISWAIKESLYKIHGRKQLSLKQNIAIPDAQNLPSHHMKANLLFNSRIELFKLNYCYWDDFYIVYSCVD